MPGAMKQTEINFPARRLRSKTKEVKDASQPRPSSLPPMGIARTPRKRRTNAKKASTPPESAPESPVNVCSSPRKAAAQSPLKALDSPRKSPRKILSEITTQHVTPVRSPSKTPLVPSIRSAPVTPNNRAGPPSARKSLFKRDTARYAEAKQALSTAVPQELVGRKEQMASMKKFLDAAFGAGGKGKKVAAADKRSMYISGAPGTGKTACLQHLLRDMAGRKEFKEVFVNCMALKNSKDIYVRIAKELKPKADVENSSQAKRAVEEEICANRVLLVLDEIDQLDSKDQEVLYSIFEWPYLKGSRLVLVGIANSLDLTDRILPRLKLTAAMSPEQLSFPAYTKDEITKIVVSRLREAGSGGCSGQDENAASGHEPIIKPMAIKFIAGKIASLSGDIRKALDVCRRAIELAEIEYRKQTILSPMAGGDQAASKVKQIDLPQVLKIFNEVYSSRVTASLKSGSGSDLPSQQKMLLATLLLMTNYSASKCKEVSLGKLHETYVRICKKRNLLGLDVSETSSMCTLLEARGIFSLRKAKNVRDVKVSIRIDEKDVETAMQDKTMLSSIVSDVSCIVK